MNLNGQLNTTCLKLDSTVIQVAGKAWRPGQPGAVSGTISATTSFPGKIYTGGGLYHDRVVFRPRPRRGMKTRWSHPRFSLGPMALLLGSTGASKSSSAQCKRGAPTCDLKKSSASASCSTQSVVWDWRRNALRKLAYACSDWRSRK